MDRDERIRQLAHRIWESEGRPHGEEQRHWHMAVRLVEAGERGERIPAAPAVEPAEPAEPTEPTRPKPRKPRRAARPKSAGPG